MLENKTTIGDKDTLICKVSRFDVSSEPKATMAEERSSSQNCHSIRPFTPLIFMCWENKIQGDSVILLLEWGLTGPAEVPEGL